MNRGTKRAIARAKKQGAPVVERDNGWTVGFGPWAPHEKDARGQNDRR